MCFDVRSAAIGDELLDAVLPAAAAAGWEPGRIASSPTADAHEVRRCALSTGIPPELLGRLNALVTHLGRQLYGFDVQGLAPYDPAYVMRYEVGDHFAWHVDNGIAQPPLGSRKLSFSLQLSHADDYDGGDLEMASLARDYHPELTGPSPLMRQHGHLIIFPSFTLHRVTPVTRGVRHAIVGWIHGPPFR